MTSGRKIDWITTFCLQKIHFSLTSLCYTPDATVRWLSYRQQVRPYCKLHHSIGKKTAMVPVAPVWGGGNGPLFNFDHGGGKIPYPVLGGPEGEGLLTASLDSEPSMIRVKTSSSLGMVGKNISTYVLYCKKLKYTCILLPKA